MKGPACLIKPPLLLLHCDRRPSASSTLTSRRPHPQALSRETGSPRGWVTHSPTPDRHGHPTPPQPAKQAA